MNLLQLDILGFKSFQNRTTFKFDTSLIGIVGPNGSGKSNIIDAIRWVLGEQSAKNLRGSSMKDVIFSGTESIRGKNFAEVAVTFGNSKEKREIKRRLYRNGDSEYFIDNKKAKLKELTNLYFDLGINKESYSIITQGKVEDIISSKPIDRRSIIEETAGVLKYKNKKKETTLKLEKTNDNIKRLNDIFLEIESRHDVLVEQKEITEKYLNYTNELQQKDILINVYNIENSNKELQIIESKKNDVVKEKTSLEQKQEEISKNLEAIKNSLITLDKTYLKYHEEELNLVQKRESLQSELNVVEERRNNRTLRSEKLDEDKKYLDDRKSGLLARLSEREKIISEVVLKINELTDQIVTLEKGSEKATIHIEQKIEKLKDIYFNLINEETRLQNNIEFIKKEQENSDENVKKLADTLKTLEASYKEKLENYNILQKEKENDVETLSVYESEVNKLLERNIKLAGEEKYITEQLKQGVDFQNNLDNRKNFIEGQINSLSFYNVGVKEILANKQTLTGVHNSVANIINFENNYALALDTALGLAQQNIVVEDDRVAKNCIEYLKKNNKGRVTFLPLTNIKEKKINSTTYNILLNEQGFINIAENLVSYDIKYKNIISHLLGLVIIVDNLDNANKIARKIDFKNRIITLDGQVINSGGSITGGAINKNNNSLIKNKAELEEVVSNLKQVNEKVIKLQEQQSKYQKNYSELREQLEKNKTERDNLVLKIKENEFKEALLKDELENINDSLDDIKYKLNDYEKTNLKADNLLTMKNRLSNIKEELVSVDEDIKKLNEQKIILQTEEDSYLENIANLKIEKSKLEETVRSNKDLISNYKNDLEEVHSQLTRLEFSLATDNMSEEDEQKILEENSKIIKESTERLNILKNLLQDLDFEKTDLYKREKLLTKEYSENNEVLREKISYLEHITIEKTKLEVKLDEYLQLLINKYETTFERMASSLTGEHRNQIEDYKAEVQHLKQKISSLGNVNLNAIDEYNELKERYDFYKTQIGDLVEAKEKLEQTIFEIDKEVQERFLTTFVKVAENFNKIFTQLFKGGYANMILENPKDLLNTGVIIEASPPGKKLQNLSLLSGGEKSLTAISLLFAILQEKDSPFVILDEVEAALDEVNIMRFAKFLKVYSENNQFLVITHRRGTMETMDKLYGVTMREKGISYVLPLQLNEIIEKGEYN